MLVGVGRQPNGIRVAARCRRPSGRSAGDELNHSFANIIEHVSQSETLHHGDVIGSGTIGEGCGLELGQ
nr:fumarylacetoacetate hydrolase family protein [Natrinema gari]